MRFRRLMLLLPAALAPLGCSVPQHSNTLLFATNTVVALDVSANATTAAPNITLGYKRQEMAWVPLLANGKGPDKERQPAACSGGSADPCVFVGRDGSSVDAYSVLATFAGNTAASGSGGSGTPSTSVKGGIAQFFATGLAARILAEKGGAQLVNSAATSPSAEEVVATWNRMALSDEQKLNDYFARTGGYTALRDTLVDHVPLLDAGTAANLKQQPDQATLLGFARTNFLTNRLAAAIPAATAALSPTAAPAAPVVPEPPAAPANNGATPPAQPR